MKIGARYSHSTDGGRYEINGFPLTSGTMRRQGLEFVCYHCVLTHVQYVREKQDFISKMIAIDRSSE